MGFPGLLGGFGQVTTAIIFCHSTAAGQLVHLFFYLPATQNHRNTDNFPSSTELTGIVSGCMVKQIISGLPCLRERILEVDEGEEGVVIEVAVEAAMADIRIKRKQRSRRKNPLSIWKSTLTKS